jgi:hypothetical protein
MMAIPLDYLLSDFSFQLNQTAKTSVVTLFSEQNRFNFYTLRFSSLSFNYGVICTELSPFIKHDM